MLILQRRGAAVETQHPVRVVVARDAEIVAQTGPALRSPWRSAAKPFQLWGSLEALGDPMLESVDVAIGASSHAGQEGHVAHIRGLLASFGLSEDGLLCGAEPPLHRPTWESMLHRGEAHIALHNDCSGKHSFMLAACERNGWDRDYRPPSHPLQQRILALITDWAGEAPDLATDGCSIPTAVLSIDGMALAWARLAACMAEAGDTWPDPQRSLRETDAGTSRAASIGWAMARHPWWTSGDDRLDLAVARAARVPMVGKIGAQGIFCMAFPDERLGVAIKVASGDEDALAVAVDAVCQQLLGAAWQPFEPWAAHTVRNVVGWKVGERVAVGGLGV